MSRVIIALALSLALSSVGRSATLPLQKRFDLPADKVASDLAKEAPLVVVLHKTNQISISNYLDGQELSRFPIAKDDLSHPEYVRISPSGDLIAIVNYWSPHVIVYDGKTGARLYQVEYWGVSDSPRIEFSKDGRFAIIGDPWIVDGAQFSVVEAKTGKLVTRTGYAKGRGEEGFYGLRFVETEGSLSVLSLSMDRCQLSLWDLTSGTEKSLYRSCGRTLKVNSDSGLFAKIDNNGIDVFNLATNKVTRIVNHYAPPKSQKPTWGDVLDFDFFGTSVLFLGAGPDLVGTYLRAFDLTTGDLRFEYEVTETNVKQLNVLHQGDQNYLVLTQWGSIYVLDLSTI